VIGKSASGAGLSSARRELRLFEQIAPLWASPAPELLGSREEERGQDARLLLLIEDLETSGYALAREGLSLTQLEGVADTLVSLHSRFWEDLQEEILDLAHPAPSVTQSAQAWPADVIAAHATAARDGTARFLGAASDELTPAERGLLAEVLDAWEGRFLARAAGARSITLIQADFHLLDRQHRRCRRRHRRPQRDRYRPLRRAPVPASRDAIYHEGCLAVAKAGIWNWRRYWPGVTPVSRLNRRRKKAGSS
jgi:hypothetical protein